MNTLLFEKQPFLERVYKEENLCKSLKVFFKRIARVLPLFLLEEVKKGKNRVQTKLETRNNS